MFSNELDDLLCLLVAAMLADKRVFSQEIEMFLTGAKTLGAIHNVDENISEARLLAWYENNNNLVRQKIKTPAFEPWLNDLLSRLSGFDNKQAILEVMAAIATADGDYHVSEKALMVLTAERWNIQVQL